LAAQEKFIALKAEFAKYAFVIAIVYSTFDEIHQIFIPGRDAEIWDWMANLLGIILGIFVIKMIINKNDSPDILESGTVKE
jgi:VanZ family protein